MPRTSGGAGAAARLAAALAAAASVAAIVARLHAAEAETKVEHVPGSRFTYIHRLPLLDPEKKPVRLEEEPVLPFSWRTTCTTKCHEYDQVRQGWHFSAVDPQEPPGRPGQPWFLCDATTGTVLPLSYRAWPNTWRPDAVGMTPWKFCLTFGRHLPGGGPGEKTDVKDPAARWLVSGKLDINCGACHSGDPAYDHVEWYLQVAGQNFMWAGAAATDLATVTGAAASMPPSYDPFMGPEDENMAKKAPKVVYDKSRFDPKGAVFFDLPSRPLDRRCWFCHSNVQVGPDAPDVWKADQDVHLAAGLSCADCHRNGPDHRITRNYEGEPPGRSAEGADAAAHDPLRATLTCRGCHLGDESAQAGPHTMGSRLGAPVPVHEGLPTIHLEHLACTTCHSGLYPQARTQRTQTSRAHALEFQGAHRGPEALPHIVEPVFVRRPYDGTIGPERMVWPAFWARLEAPPAPGEAEKVTPLAPEAVYETAKDAFTAKIEADGQEQKGLVPERVAAVLKMLAEKGEAKAAYGYVAAGRLYRLSADGALESSDHPAAAPVGWPVAHDVRPARYALGAGECTDCHGFGAPVAFGEVDVPSPARLGPPAVKAMWEFQGRDPLELQAWAMSYLFRPMFKAVGFATAAVIGAVLLAYAILGLAALARWAARKAPPGPAEVG